MTENSEHTRTKASQRPSLEEARTYKFGVKTDKESVFKAYFDGISSKGMKDPFNKHYRTEYALNIIKPPLNPYALAKLVYENSFLAQCIEAMVQNIHGFGYRLEFIGKKDQETSPAVMKELKWLEELFDRPNTTQSFQEFRTRLGWDYYVFANAYMECTRDADGKILTMHHVPSPTMRMTKVEETAVPVVETIARYGKILKIKSTKYFRRFVQLDEMGNKVWFKEFGDPRTLDPKTGLENNSLTKEQGATEIIHLGNYNAQSIYGIPTWYTQLPSILGSRQAELTNLDFFENNAIPAMAVLVAGGYLTEEAYDFLANNFEQIKGRGATNKILILEARGTVEDASNTGMVPTPSITMKALGQERQNDALWQEYEKQCRDKIRASFRLAPVLVGAATDYTFASARVSLEVAENQIFIPERVKFDDIINQKVLATWNPEFFRFRSSPAAIATSEDLINAMNAFNDSGAITPNTAIGILNEKLNLDIPRVEEFWGDIPFQMVNSILRAQGGEDKTNFLVHALQMLGVKDVGDLKPISVLTPGNADSPAQERTPGSPVANPKDTSSE